MLLVIERRPAAAGGWMPAGPAQMQRNRKSVSRTSFQDWPITATPQRLQSARRDHDMRKPPIAGALLDLLDCGFGIFQRDLHTGLQTRLTIAPDLCFPFVRR